MLPYIAYMDPMGYAIMFILRVCSYYINLYYVPDSDYIEEIEYFVMFRI